MVPNAIDVLVVGAGPTGLTLACELRRHGVGCRVIETLTEQVIWSKAAAVHARTLEVFDHMGVVDAFLAYANAIDGVRVYSGEELVAHVGFEGIDSPYPHVYGASQRDTELVLARHLESLGGSIERGVTLTSFEETDAGVLARVNGTDEIIEARYLVGCDGAHSTVRKALGFTFEGSAYEEHLLQADVRVDLPDAPAKHEVRAYLSPTGPLAMFPLFKDGRYRVIAFLMPGTPEPEATIGTFQRLVDERGPKGARLSDPAWMVPFRIHCRRTNHYRKGRVLVAGDAAHIHSPVGGQGMNTGIQDAYNLAWKLALAVRGRASAALLDSYEGERSPIAETLLALTDAATRGIELFGALKNPIAAGVRNRLMGLLTGLDAVQTRFTRQISMIEIHYGPSAIIAEDRSPVLSRSTLGLGAGEEAPSLLDRMSFAEGPAPGHRATGLALDDGTSSTRLFRGTKHVLLLFDGGSPTAEGFARLASIAGLVEARWADVVEAHVVVPYATRPAALPPSVPVVCDASGALHRRFGARSESLYLVRPDGYVGYRAQPADGGRLEGYLTRVFGA